MKICFVGIKRKYQALPTHYIDKFNQFHLELPFYYAKFGGHRVVISTVDYNGATVAFSEGSLICTKEENLRKDSFDLAIHWRKWFDDLYCPGAINVINCQDHSFSPEWKTQVINAFQEGKCRGLLCFTGWHKENLFKELNGIIPRENLFDGLTLGVDPEIYHPNWEQKDPYQMLWASDLNRGINQAIELTVKLYQKNKRFRLHVCYPDYTQGYKVNHPALIWHQNIPNGNELWNLFNNSAILPYTCNFPEPSSRCHRQAQAAGLLVFFPPQMGTPSELIQHEKTGLVQPIDTWVEEIYRRVNDCSWKEIAQQAVEFAQTESWEVQAKKFTQFFKENF